MKKTILCAALALALGGAGARALSLDDVCTALAENPNTTGTFVQTRTISSINRTITSSGNFVMCSAGILWETVRPFASTLVLEENFMLQIGADGTPVASDISGNETFKTVAGAISALFSGDAARMRQNFDIEFTEGADGTWSCALAPRDNTVKSVMGGVTLSGVHGGGTCELRSLLMTEQSGDTVSYSFENQVHPAELPDDETRYFTQQ